MGRARRVWTSPPDHVTRGGEVPAGKAKCVTSEGGNKKDAAPPAVAAHHLPGLSLWGHTYSPLFTPLEKLPGGGGGEGTGCLQWKRRARLHSQAIPWKEDASWPLISNPWQGEGRRGMLCDHIQGLPCLLCWKVLPHLPRPTWAAMQGQWETWDLSLGFAIFSSCGQQGSVFLTMKWGYPVKETTTT